MTEIFLNGPETTPEPLLHEAQVHIGYGWRVALRDLAGEGRRWLVTPWVNSGDTDLQDLLTLMAPGDRLIIRGRPEDFRDRMSSFGAVDQFIRRGVEVRRFPHLHAKMYAREDPVAPVVWIGSANLTRRGSHGDLRGHGNYEAMSGPHPFTSAHLETLTELWDNPDRCRVYDRQALEDEVSRLCADAETYAAHLVTGSLGTLSLQLGFRLLRGQMTVPALWLGMPERQGVSFPAVRFVAGDHALSRELNRLRYRLQTTLKKLAVPVAGTPLLYVLPVWKQPEIERALQAFQLRTMGDLEGQFRSEHTALQKDFLARFEVAFAEFTNVKYPNAWPLETVLPLANEAFNAYVASDPFGVVAQYSVPLPNASDPYDPLFQAVARARQHPRPLESGVGGS